MKTFVAAAGLAAALALSAGSAQAGGHVNWSIGINLPPVGAVISSGPQYRSYGPPVYSSDYYDAPAYGGVVVPAPVYAPPPVVVYRQAPPVLYPRPPAFVGYYAPSPIVYGAPGGRWHDGRGGWRDGRSDDRWDGRGHGSRGDSRDSRWAPVPRDERRQRH